MGLQGVSGDVQPGFFIGHTEASGHLSIAADSIHALFFQCGSDDVTVVFTPPEPVAGDGSFAVEFTDAGRHFTVTGRFLSQNHVEGSIEGDADCDGNFEADRCNESRQNCNDVDNDFIPDEIDPDQTTPQHTPVRTATPLGIPTPTQAVATATGGGGGETPTPAATSTRTHTPTPTRTAIGLCGNGMVDSDADEQCDPTATPQFDPDVTCDPVDFPCVCDSFCNDGDFTPIICNNRCQIDFSHCANPGDCSF